MENGEVFNGGDRFEIIGNEIRLKAGATLDYEEEFGFEIVVEAYTISNPTGPVAHQGDFIINLLDENEQPSVPTLSSSTVAENSNNDTPVGTLSSIDPEAENVTFTFATNGDAGGRFKIVGNQILVANGTLLDHETNPSHQVTVIASDGVTTREQTFIITVTDVPENTNGAPHTVRLNGLTAVTVDENSTVVGTLSAVDPDGNPITGYSIVGGNPNNLFTIVRNASVFEIRVAGGQTLDYEALVNKFFDLQVTATDGNLVSEMQTIRVNVADVPETPGNDAPNFGVVGQTVFHATDTGAAVNPFAGVTLADNENNPITLTISFTDADGVLNATAGGGVTVSNSLSGGTRTFTFVGLAADLQTFLDGVTFNPVDRANAGGQVTTNFTFTLKDDAHPATTYNNGVQVVTTVVGTNYRPTDINLSNRIVDENSSGVQIGGFSAVDQNVNDHFTFALVVTDNYPANNLFHIVNGVLYLKTGVSLDFEQTPFVNIRVRATDQGGLSYTKTIRIDVRDLPETTNRPPTDVVPVIHVNENTAPGWILSSFDGIDPDGPGGLTYSLQNDDGTFEIVNGQLRVKGNLNYEAKSVHQVTVRVADSAGLFYDKVIKINVNNVNERPDVNLPTLSIAEHTATGTKLDTLLGIDPDSGDSLTFRLVGSASGRFALNSNNEIVVANGSALDCEQFKSHSITVRVTDRAGLYQDRHFNIVVTDRNNEVSTGTSGKDKIVGGIGADRFSGAAGNDQLFGGAGNDTLTGDANDDRLYGGLGNDQLTGGTGKDIFVFDTKPATSTNRDRIVDFKAADDTIYLNNASGLFTKLSNGWLKSGAFYAGARAHDADDRIIYNKSTGVLYYDADGTGRGSAIQFAVLNNKALIKYTDFYVL